VLFYLYRCAVHQGLSDGAIHPCVHADRRSSGRRAYILGALFANTITQAGSPVRSCRQIAHLAYEITLDSFVVLPSRVVRVR